MADIFVNSNAVGLNDGSDWANAYTSITSTTSAADNDRVIVANVHSETFGAATTLTYGSNISIICSTVSGTNTVTETESSILNLQVNANLDLTFNATDGGSIYGLQIESGQDLVFNEFRTERCKLICGGANPSSCFIGPAAAGSSWESYHCDHDSASTVATQSVIRTSNRTKAKILGGTLSTSSANNAQLAFEIFADSTILVDAVDCTGFDRPNLVGVISSNDGYVQLTNIKVNSATTNLLESTTTKQGATIIIHAVDDTNNQRSYNNEYRGQRFSDDNIYIANADAFQNQSHRFETNSVTKGLVEPLRLELAHGIADFSSLRTLTIEIAQDGTTTNLTDAEVWIEVNYPGALNQTLMDDNRAANTPAAVNQPTSTETWTGLSGTNARQALSVTTTQLGVNGLYSVYLCVAKPSTTVYANPQATVA